MDLSQVPYLPSYAVEWLRNEFPSPAALESPTLESSGSSNNMSNQQYNQSYGQAPTPFYPPFSQSALRAENHQNTDEAARTSSQQYSAYGTRYPSQTPVMGHNPYPQISSYSMRRHSDLRSTENTPATDTSLPPDPFFTPSPSRELVRSEHRQVRRHRIRAHVDHRDPASRLSRRDSATASGEHHHSAKPEVQSPRDNNLFFDQATQGGQYSSPITPHLQSNPPYEEPRPPAPPVDRTPHQVPSTPVFPPQSYSTSQWNYTSHPTEPPPEPSSIQSQNPLSPSTLTPQSQQSQIPMTASSTVSPAAAAQPSTVFIHTNLPRETTTTDEASEDYVEYRHLFPHDTDIHRRLRVAMHDVMHSQWKALNDLEPTSADLLQFSKRSTRGDGVTIYKCLLHHQGRACTKSWNRSERMLAHIRRVINLRPFACEGDGQLCNCGARFFAEDTLQQHRKNTQAIACQYCNASVTPRNIKRHQRSNCPITTANRPNPPAQPQ